MAQSSLEHHWGPGLSTTRFLHSVHLFIKMGSLLGAYYARHGDPVWIQCREMPWKSEWGEQALSHLILYQLSHEGSPRILEWVAYPFSSRPSRPRNGTGVSWIAGGFFANWTIREALDVDNNKTILHSSLDSCTVSCTLHTHHWSI